MNNAIAKLGVEKVKALVLAFSAKYDIPSSLHIDYVCNICCENQELAPNLSRNGLCPEDSVQRWVYKFIHGYNERISERKSKMPGTVPDRAVDTIIDSVLHCHAKSHIHNITYAHRLCMSAENILGLLLEEFLFEKLAPRGWAMAWGETIRSVDFCNAEGYMLQIKNRSNSENSSSSKIRTGKPIDKWYRINAINGQCEWEKLRHIVGDDVREDLNEEQFQEFIRRTLQKNPDALAIETENPWRLQVIKI